MRLLIPSSTCFPYTTLFRSYGRAINAATELSALVVKIEHLLKDELAPIKYSRAITEQRDNEVVQRNLSEIVSIVRGWCDEKDSYLYKNNYIEVEVISYVYFY